MSTTKASEIEPELLTPQQAARMLGISITQFRRCVKAGRIPQPVRIASDPRWRAAELRQFINDLQPSRTGSMTTADMC